MEPVPFCKLYRSNMQIILFFIRDGKQNINIYQKKKAFTIGRFDEAS